MAVELRGNLTNERMVEVLRSLKDNHFYGTFIISDGIIEKCFFFTRGGLRLVTAGRNPILVSDYLFAQGLLNADQARDFAERLRERKEVTKYDFAEASGQSTDQIDELERNLMGEEFLETLFWPDCYFEFKAGDPDEEAYQNNLSARLLSLGIPKLVDSMIESIIGLRDIKRRFESVFLQVNLQPAGQAVLANPSSSVPLSLLKPLIKSGKTIRELADIQVGVSEFALIEQVHNAVEAGWVSVGQRRDLEDDEFRFDRIRKLEEGLDQAISPIMKRQALARTYQKHNDRSMAAQHFKRAGLLMLRARRDSDAAKELRQAVDLDQEDFEAKEGLVEALWASKQSDSARDEAEKLSRKYFDLGLANRARLVLERAVNNVPRDLGLKNLLVRTYLRLGRSEKALELGRGLCEELRAVGREEEALGLAGRFVDAGVDADRVLVMSGEKRKRMLQKGLFAASFLLLLIVIPTGLSARSALQLSKKSQVVTQLVRSGQYDEAEARLNELESDLFGVTSKLISLRSEISETRDEFEVFRTQFKTFVDSETGRINWSKGNDLETAEDVCNQLSASEDRRVAATAKQLKKSLLEHKKRGAVIQSEYEIAHQTRDGARAYKLAQLYLKKYRNITDSYRKFRSIGMPVRLTLIPGNAEIKNLVSSKLEQGGGLYFVPLGPREITVQAPGYESKQIHIVPREMPFEMTIELKKQ